MRFDLPALLPRRIQIVLATDGVHLQQLDWRGRPGAVLAHLAAQEGAPQSWQAALTVLKAWLGTQGGVRFEARLLLSDRHVRYQHLPWRPGIVGLRERQAYAGHRFREVYGELAGGWQIALSDGMPGNASLACAVDRELLTGLRALAPQLKIVSLQPLFAAAYNRACRGIREPRFWFAHVEPGRLCLGMFRDGQNMGLRNEACAAAWPDGLAALQRRLQFVDGDEGAAPIYVAGQLQGVPLPQMLGVHPLHVIGN